MTLPTHRYDGRDFYCDGAIPNAAEPDVVHDGAGVLAYHHTRPFWEVHIVVLPKRHVASLTDAAGADDALVRELLTVVKDVAATVEANHNAKIGFICGRTVSNSPVAVRGMGERGPLGPPEQKEQS